LRLLFFLFAPLLAVAGDLTLSGTVVNSQTGEPVKRALVTVLELDNRQQRGETPNFSTDSGTYQFTGLTAATYFIRVAKPGYVNGSGVGNRPVELTASKSDLRLELSPLGVITGRAVDASGQPLRGVRILAITTSVRSGLRSTNQSRSVATDDRGMYRLWNLQPGKYYIKAAGFSGGTYTYLGDATPQFFTSDGFRPTYSGGGSTLDSAQPIDIAPGAEAHADLNLSLEPSYKVRGVLSNISSGKPVTFELLTSGETVTASRVSLNRTSGRFELQDVVPGVYKLRVAQEKHVALAPLSVKAQDVENLAVRLSPPLEIAGISRATNTRPESAAFEELAPRFRNQAPCRPQLTPANAQLPETINAQSTEQGTFTFTGVPLGVYSLDIHCFGAYVHSAMSGTQDLLANPTLVLTSENPPAPIELAYAFGGGGIHGRISVPGAGTGTFMVLAVPQFGGPGQSQTSLATNQDGEAFEFSFGSLAPGSYLVYAFPDSAEVEFRNPKVLAALKQGTPVQVTGDAVTEITIKEVAR